MPVFFFRASHLKRKKSDIQDHFNLEMWCITEIFLNLHMCFRCDMMFKISDIIAFCKPVSAVIVPCSNHVYSYWFKHEQCNLNLNPQSCFGNLLMPIVLKVCGVSARLQAVSW